MGKELARNNEWIQSIYEKAERISNIQVDNSVLMFRLEG